MKTIKIIDLLNKIANGEEVPEIISYDFKVWRYNSCLYDYECEIDQDSYLFELLTKSYCDYLNMEVEIIEEKKIPEKLTTWFSLEKDCENDNIQYANHNFEIIYKKVNEIIDYLESKEKGDE